jgi:hypothetical protein
LSVGEWLKSGSWRSGEATNMGVSTERLTLCTAENVCARRQLGAADAGIRSLGVTTGRRLPLYGLAHPRRDFRRAGGLDR